MGKGSEAVMLAAFPWGVHLHIEVSGLLHWGFYRGLIASHKVYHTVIKKNYISLRTKF
jgi:hypothetical protein